jgi:hypothetical protein
MSSQVMEIENFTKRYPFGIVTLWKWELAWSIGVSVPNRLNERFRKWIRLLLDEEIEVTILEPCTDVWIIQIHDSDQWEDFSKVFPIDLIIWVSNQI